MRSYRIHLIRCGYTENTIKGIYEGKNTDIPICEESSKQIAQMDKDYTYPYSRTVFIPNHERCFDTYMLLYPDASYAKMDGLSECDFGEFDGKTADELSILPEYKEWLKGEPSYCPPGGECSGEFSKRVCETFIGIFNAMVNSETEDVVIIAPGGVIMTICTFFAIPERNMTDWLTSPGCGYTLRTDSLLWNNLNKFELMREIPFDKDSIEELNNDIL